MAIVEIIAYLIGGALAGCLAGMLGIGGGIVFVPTQMFIYSLIGMPADVQMKTAVGTSLTAIVFTALASVRAQTKRKAVQWKVIYKIALGIAIGAVSGTILTRIIPSGILQLIFGVFLILVGIRFFFGKILKEHVQDRIPNYFIFNTIGWGIGAFSAMLGVGGGVMTVPTLVHFHLPLKQAIGTSSAVGLMLAFCGSIAFLIPSGGDVGQLHYNLGYVYFPALIPLVIGSVLMAPVGVHLAHTLPHKVIKRIFGIFVVSAGVLMVVKGSS